MKNTSEEDKEFEQLYYKLIRKWVRYFYRDPEYIIFPEIIIKKGQA